MVNPRAFYGQLFPTRALSFHKAAAFPSLQTAAFFRGKALLSCKGHPNFLQSWGPPAYFANPPGVSPKISPPGGKSPRGICSPVYGGCVAWRAYARRFCAVSAVTGSRPPVRGCSHFRSAFQMPRAGGRAARPFRAQYLALCNSCWFKCRPRP